MVELKDILYKTTINAVIGNTGIKVNSIEFDSRKVELNDVFVAIRGTLSDGHDFIEKAVNQGAIAIVCEEFPSKIINGVTYVRVENSNEALAHLANNFYDNPSSKLRLVGVTGTNGKTTITSLLYKIFNNQGIKSGLISTINIEYEEFTENSKNTTPDPILLNHHLNEMVKRNIKVCFVEVSSHGIKQKRVFGKDFKGIVFTNLTHDHIDYHKTFKDYRDTKKEVFDTLNKNSFALINIDDKNGKFMTQNSSARVYTYSIKSKSNFSCRIVEQQLNGMLLNIENSEIWTKLIGEFNAYNVLAIYSVGKIYEIDSLNLLTNISELNSVQGRLQSFLSNSNVTVIIDYAHTPDAVENVLSTINKIKKSNQNLITVIGCGGDRDKAKRSMIGKICSDLSYKVIFTSDNPRSENPESIIKDIVSGVSNYNNNKILVEIERSKAIEEAKKNSEEGDIVLIAGKGHEDYQIFKNKVIKFDDFKIAKKIFNK